MIKLSEQNTFLKSIVYRLIKKHISGTTVNAAFKLTKNLNDKDMAATITFLNENVNDTGKARYNLNSYMQLIKQISRLNLNASISVRMSQLGLTLPNGIIEHNMLSLLTTAKSSHVNVWFEYEDALGLKGMVDLYRRYNELYDGIGVELPLRHPRIEQAIGTLPKAASVKLISHYHMNEPEESNRYIMILIYKDIKVYLICCGDILSTELKLLSLKELFSKLHNDIKVFLVDTRNAIERNNEVGFDDIKRVREHITERLNNGESVEDNEEILKVLNLFTMDKAFLQITSEETEGWIEFLNAIEESMKDLDKRATTSEERHDLEEINEALVKAKQLLRK